MGREDGRRLLFWLTPAALAVATHLGSLANGLVYDDPLAVEQARAPLLELLPRRYGVTAASIHLDHLLWPGSVPGLHLTNLLLHAAATTVAMASALALGASRTVAFWCALLFAVHPVHVEAVASIENRKEILAMLFGGATVVLHRRGGGVAATAAAVATFLLALGAKDVAAVGLVVALPLADGLLGVAGAERRRARRRLGALVVAAVLGGAWLARGTLADPTEVRRATRIFATHGQALATSAAAVPELLRLLVVPGRLSADYPKNVRSGPADPQAMAGVAVLAGWLLAAGAVARRSALGALAMLWPVVMYVPLANVLVPLTPYPVAERYLYVPSFGVCLLAAMGLAARGRPGAAPVRRRVVPAIGIVLVLAGAARSAARVREWRDGQALWTAALRAFPEGSTRIHAELGVTLLGAGRAAEAIPHLERALAIGPPEATFYNNLGLALWQAGRRAEAVAPFERAVALWPSHQMMRVNLGYALLHLGRVAEARAQLAPLADPAAWREVDRSALVALHAQHATPESMRASIARWVAGADAPAR